MTESKRALTTPETTETLINHYKQAKEASHIQLPSYLFMLPNDDKGSRVNKLDSIVKGLQQLSKDAPRSNSTSRMMLLGDNPLFSKEFESGLQQIEETYTYRKDTDTDKPLLDEKTLRSLITESKEGSLFAQLTDTLGKTPTEQLLSYFSQDIPSFATKSLCNYVQTYKVADQVTDFPNIGTTLVALNQQEDQLHITGYYSNLMRRQQEVSGDIVNVPLLPQDPSASLLIDFRQPKDDSDALEPTFRTQSPELAKAVYQAYCKQRLDSLTSAPSGSQNLNLKETYQYILDHFEETDWILAQIQKLNEFKDQTQVDQYLQDTVIQAQCSIPLPLCLSPNASTDTLNPVRPEKGLAHLASFSVGAHEHSGKLSIEGQPLSSPDKQTLLETLKAGKSSELTEVKLPKNTLEYFNPLLLKTPEHLLDRHLKQQSPDAKLITDLRMDITQKNGQININVLTQGFIAEKNQQHNLLFPEDPNARILLNFKKNPRNPKLQKTAYTDSMIVAKALFTAFCQDRIKQLKSSSIASQPTFFSEGKPKLGSGTPDKTQKFLTEVYEQLAQKPPSDSKLMGILRHLQTLPNDPQTVDKFFGLLHIQPHLTAIQDQMDDLPKTFSMRESEKLTQFLLHEGGFFIQNSSFDADKLNTFRVEELPKLYDALKAHMNTIEDAKRKTSEEEVDFTTPVLGLQNPRH